MRPEIAILIVNYNAGDDLRRALESGAAECAGSGWEAVVVDNASTDGSASHVAAFAPNATLVRLAAAHVSSLELPRTFARTVLEWLSPRSGDRYDGGLNVRRAVLGEAYVDRALSSGTDLTRDFQALITRYAWGDVWSRPGLDERTRRLLVLAITAALGRREEFHLHLAAGLDHGLQHIAIHTLLAAHQELPYGGRLGMLLGAIDQKLARQGFVAP